MTCTHTYEQPDGRMAAASTKLGFCRDCNRETMPPVSAFTKDLGPIKITPPDPHAWQRPYRSMAASGSPETATAVAWAWIEAEADEARRAFPTGRLDIITPGGDIRRNNVIVLQLECAPIAVATIYRDEMNFAVLVRWRAKG